MNDFKLVRTQGILLAIMNALVVHFKLGNFMIQMDSGQPAILNAAGPTDWMRGYTDTGNSVSAQCNLTLGSAIGRLPYLVQSQIAFVYKPTVEGDTVFCRVVCEYSPDRGIVVTQV